MSAGIAVPIPGATEIAALFNDADVFDSSLAQVCTREEPTKATANDDDVFQIGQRFALDLFIDVGVLFEVSEITLNFMILARLVFPDPLITLLRVLFANGLKVEV